MTRLPILAGAMLMLAGTASAQTTTHTRGIRPLPAQPEVPVDKGPFTPEASTAYQGGGVILQGAPGAPAPKPEPTPPGQTPRNAVE